jgi:universal stress protein E
MNSKRWKSILAVVADPFAREQPTAVKAAAIARRCGARLTLFNSFMIPQPVSDVPMDSQQEIIESAIRQRRERLRKIASGLRSSDAVDCVVHWDYPAHEAIVREVLKVEPDLVVTGSHRRGRLARLVLANTDWELIRTCPCPVWFVRSPKLSRSPRLLVAVDPRHAHAKPARLDDRLLAAARASTHQLDGRISIVHAYEVPASVVPITQAVQRLARRCAIDAADTFISEGSPANVVAARVRQLESDVLVMGAVSRSVPSGPVIGNTAERVIDQVDCDVFVIKPAGFKTPVRLRAPASAAARPLARGRQLAATP